MYRLSRFTLTLGLLLLVPTLVLADEPKRDEGPRGGRRGPADRAEGGPRGGFGGPRLAFGMPGGEFLASWLKLSDEQKKKVEALHKKFEADFLAILTPEQKKKVEDMKSRFGRFGGARGEARGGEGRGERGTRRTGPERKPETRAPEKKAEPKVKPEDARRQELEKKLDRLLKELEDLRKEIKK